MQDLHTDTNTSKQKLSTTGKTIAYVIIEITLVFSSLATTLGMDRANINRSVNNSNRSGYAVTGSTRAVTSVTESWIVPAFTSPGTAFSYFEEVF
jgi:hypothetical protein